MDTAEASEKLSKIGESLAGASDKLPSNLDESDVKALIKYFDKRKTTTGWTELAGEFIAVFRPLKSTRDIRDAPYWTLDPDDQSLLSGTKEWGELLKEDADNLAQRPKDEQERHRLWKELRTWKVPPRPSDPGDRKRLSKLTKLNGAMVRYIEDSYIQFVWTHFVWLVPVVVTAAPLLFLWIVNEEISLNPTGTEGKGMSGTATFDAMVAVPVLTTLTFTAIVGAMNARLLVTRRLSPYGLADAKTCATVATAAAGVIGVLLGLWSSDLPEWTVVLNIAVFFGASFASITAIRVTNHGEAALNEGATS